MYERFGRHDKHRSDDEEEEGSNNSSECQLPLFLHKLRQFLIGDETVGETFLILSTNTQLVDEISLRHPIILETLITILVDNCDDISGKTTVLIALYVISNIVKSHHNSFKPNDIQHLLFPLLSSGDEEIMHATIVLLDQLITSPFHIINIYETKSTNETVNEPMDFDVLSFLLKILQFIIEESRYHKLFISSIILFFHLIQNSIDGYRSSYYTTYVFNSACETVLLVLDRLENDDTIVEFMFSEACQLNDGTGMLWNLKMLDILTLPSTCHKILLPSSSHSQQTYNNYDDNNRSNRSKECFAENDRFHSFGMFLSTLTRRLIQLFFTYNDCDAYSSSSSSASTSTNTSCCPSIHSLGPFLSLSSKKQLIHVMVNIIDVYSSSPALISNIANYETVASRASNSSMIIQHCEEHYSPNQEEESIMDENNHSHHFLSLSEHQCIYLIDVLFDLCVEGLLAKDVELMEATAKIILWIIAPTSSSSSNSSSSLHSSGYANDRRNGKSYEVNTTVTAAAAVAAAAAAATTVTAAAAAVEKSDEISFSKSSSFIVKQYVWQSSLLLSNHHHHHHPCESTIPVLFILLDLLLLLLHQEEIETRTNTNDCNINMNNLSNTSSSSYISTSTSFVMYLKYLLIVFPTLHKTDDDDDDEVRINRNRKDYEPYYYLAVLLQIFLDCPVASISSSFSSISNRDFSHCLLHFRQS